MQSSRSQLPFKNEPTPFFCVGIVSIMFLFGAIKILIFTHLLITVCLFCILGVVLIRPLSKNVYKRYKGVLSDMTVCFLWQILFSRVKIELKTDTKTYELLGKESAILIANHQHALDNAILLVVNQFFGSFANTLSLSKNSIKYHPLYGWISWLSSRFIYLERNWKNDALTLKTALGVVKRSYRPWWFIVFPEGTRFTPQKLVAARDYATSQGLHVPRNVLVPRTKGFVSIVNYSREHFKAVYDLTLIVPHGCLRPTITNILKGEETAIKIHIKRYPMEELPESDENVAIWCRQRFSDKDAFFDKYMVQQGEIDGQISCTIRNRKPIHVAGVWACFLLQVSVVVCYLYFNQIQSTTFEKK